MSALYARGDSTLLFRSIIGEGFRDSTRVAAGDASLWEQILQENSKALTENLDGTIAILQRWRNEIAEGAAPAMLSAELAEAARMRQSLDIEKGDSRGS